MNSEMVYYPRFEVGEVNLNMAFLRCLDLFYITDRKIQKSNSFYIGKCMKNEMRSSKKNQKTCVKFEAVRKLILKL